VLGWELSWDADKDKPFSVTFAAWGVKFDLSAEPGAGRLLVCNTDSRRGVVCAYILESRPLSIVEAMSLRSRLLFAESQIFARMAKQSLKTIGAVGLGLSSRDEYCGAADYAFVS